MDFVSVSSRGRLFDVPQFYVPKECESSHAPQTPLPYAQVDCPLNHAVAKAGNVGGKYTL